MLLGRTASRRLLQLQWAPCLGGSSTGSSLQQWAGYAKKSRDESGGGDGKMQKLLKALEPREVEEVELSPEDMAEAERRAKEYSRARMRAHRAWQRDLSTKLQLKEAAIAALPPHLRAAAEVPDLEPFPANRMMWTETPPVEGFGSAAARAQQQGGKKSIGTKRR